MKISIFLILSSKNERFKIKGWARNANVKLAVCFTQGDRGYEGPKGSRGPPGIGYKGEKVWLVIYHG